VERIVSRRHKCARSTREAAAHCHKRGCMITTPHTPNRGATSSMIGWRGLGIERGRVPTSGGDRAVSQIWPRGLVCAAHKLFNLGVSGTCVRWWKLFSPVQFVTSCAPSQVPSVAACLEPRWASRTAHCHRTRVTRSTPLAAAIARGHRHA
jgi:hypothetical protein